MPELDASLSPKYIIQQSSRRNEWSDISQSHTKNTPSSDRYAENPYSATDDTWRSRLAPRTTSSLAKPFPRDAQLGDDTRTSRHDRGAARYREFDRSDQSDDDQLTQPRYVRNSSPPYEDSQDKRVFFVPIEGIDFDVISGDLHIYLGPDATVERGIHPKVGVALSK